MKFIATEVRGVMIVECEPHHDSRGSFARTFSREEFEQHGLVSEFPQCSTSFNRVRGTLRGLHFQREPHGEDKLVRCTAGAVFDVAVDVRRGSPTFGRWVSAELSAENRRSLYIPKGCAHGFQTLVDASEVFYQISVPYEPTASAGVKWNDSKLGIRWPLEQLVISDRDRALPPLEELQ